MHPKSKDILKVIEGFEKVLPFAKEQENLNMMMTNSCGTVCCHAGWYGNSQYGKVRRFVSFGYISYQTSAKLLANHIGFSNMSKLETWASNFPELWGNEYGRWMFSSPHSFSSQTRYFGAKRLQDIVDHWREVYLRLVEFEKNGDIRISPPQPTPKEEKPKEIIRYVSVPQSLKEQSKELILQ